MRKSIQAVLGVVLASAIFSCGTSTTEQTFDSSKLSKMSREEVEKVVEAFIMAEDSSTIEIPGGFFELNTQLILDNKKSVRIKGAGMDKTVLSFRNLKSGGEGVKIVGNNITVEDLSIEDAPGDGLKAQHSDGVTFRKVNVTWTNGDKSKNGTYAIYPVQCKNVVIDQCIASHSKDAGIYVGQSENIIVKNSLAFGNVAGIEIENSDNAEVFGNTARDNSGGILVFNLPGLPKSDGKGTKIYDNDILNNNHENFATPIGEGPNGNTVTMIPPGSGIILLAAKEVEIFNNRIHNNKTTGVAIASYQVTGFPAEAPNWSPYTTDVYVHDNAYERKALSMPDLTRELGQLVSVHNAYGPAKTQDIIYDGIWDKAISETIDSNPMRVCIQEAGIENLHFTRFYLMEGEDNIESFKDYQHFQNCKINVATDVSAIAAL
ncbi:right-handed parallel beta-helix repeat-containing protein [Algoriphagus aestuariicola]|jgi:parallel beta-helix repeat protein|uniref:Right-handed parallel beta-helix repeat-containing protein n=1 Tax=Algoriphagus aestuariicola TaxID=1852016 RepID=A0ABS3C0L5_9BACT|nr:parallel beta-helix domain-containing protein [Algoriphagus aestuariicola]MBN7803519.1 right-handed parallel beta-helix repeat-containing protein [Algoriphagus aestuariicola]